MWRCCWVVAGTVDRGDVAVGRLIHEKTPAWVSTKWDVVTDRAHGRLPGTRAPEGMPFLSHSPVVFLSAKTGHHVDDLLNKLIATLLTTITGGSTTRSSRRSFGRPSGATLQPQRKKLVFSRRAAGGRRAADVHPSDEPRAGNSFLLRAAVG